MVPTKQKTKTTDQKTDPSTSTIGPDNINYIQFTNITKGELKTPNKKQLENFKIPNTDLIINESNIEITTDLEGTTNKDLSLSLNQESLTILCKNKKIGYYLEMKLPEKIIPQSAVAIFEVGKLSVKIAKHLNSDEPWVDLVEVGQLEANLQDSKDRLIQVQKQYHSIQQEYQNLLVKSSKDIENRIDSYKISVIEKILQNIDNFELALESTSKIKNKHNEQILLGINLILNDLKNLVKEENVTEVPGEGGILDPTQHEVLECEDSEKYPENTILKVFKKGYKYKDRVIRPAKVRVSICKLTKKDSKKKKK
jgi:molecular chaperone GrpE